MQPMTGGQAFWHRLCAARQAQDLASLRELYHPDAVAVAVGTGQVLRGRDAILASFAESFEVAGGVSVKAEILMEAGAAVCVEASVATRFAQLQSYDVFLLHEGIVKQHIGGVISPRPPTGGAARFPQTRAGAFYQRWWAAMEAHDFATQASLYCPDAIYVTCAPQQYWQGRDAIMGTLQQLAQAGQSVRLKSVISFVDAENLICAEVASTLSVRSPLGTLNAQFDLLTYEVLVLRGGLVAQRFGGLITPRWSELQQAAGQQAAMAMDRSRMVWDAFQGGMNPYRGRWW